MIAAASGSGTERELTGREFNDVANGIAMERGVNVRYLVPTSTADPRIGLRYG